MRRPYRSPMASRLRCHSSACASRVGADGDDDLGLVGRDGSGVGVDAAEVLDSADRRGRAAAGAEVQLALVGGERAVGASLGEVHQLLDRQHPDALHAAGSEPAGGRSVGCDVVLHAELLQRPVGGVDRLGHGVAEVGRRPHRLHRQQQGELGVVVERR